MKKHLVIGLGEVGSSLLWVLSKKLDATGIDNGNFIDETFDFIHICLPYSKKFHTVVSAYKKQYLKKGGMCVIHSTVPVGTSRALKALHSPIRGIHPHLGAGMLTFTKYIGGAYAEKISQEFKKVRIPCKTTLKSETTEALKLWDTTIYGWNIVLEKEIWDYCKKHKIDFDMVYTDANQSYNKGYEKLGKSQYKKYVLRHVTGPVGGHCVIPNCEILNSQSAKYILRQNKKNLKKKEK